MSPRPLERLAPYSVPMLVFAIAIAVGLVVPPLVTGSMSLERTYLLTVAILILAVTHSLPYAVVVAVVTAPLVRTGVAGYAPPAASDAEGSRVRAAVRHVVVGVGYVLASAFVGAVFIGARLAGAPTGIDLAMPSGALVGGAVVGVAFVALQLRRYRAVGATLDRRTTATTAALGALLALAPVVAHWLFGRTAGGM